MKTIQMKTGETVVIERSRVINQVIVHDLKIVGEAPMLPVGTTYSLYGEELKRNRVPA